jgi:hypothetical protein
VQVSTRAKALLGIVAIAATARLVDVALIGAGIATAAGTVVFAASMVMRSDHPPGVNGLEYLAIFSRPRGGPPSAVKDPSDRPFNFAAAAVDPTPVGSIGAHARGDAQFAMVGAELGFAWVREGTRVFAVRPGDTIERLGRVTAIVRRDGHWALMGDAGAVLLTSEYAEPTTDKSTRFARPMIFGNGK